MTAPRGKVIAAFFAIYVIWGSTYLAIRFAIETIPPFLMASSRFVLAGVVLYLFARVRGAARPTLPEWRAGGIVGCLLMTGNACVAVAERRIPSGVAALLVAMTPLFMVLLEWMRPGGKRPTAGVFAGLFIGLAGVATLIGPASFAGGGRIDPAGAGIVVFGSLSWALGSIYSRHAAKPPSALMMTATQMLIGGIFLGLCVIPAGELGGFSLGQVSLRSLLAVVYLLIFGSLVAFTAFVYLLRVSTAAKVATYAYVNPVVAVILGWLFAGEAVTPRMLVAAAVIVGAVALITTTEARRQSSEPSGDRSGGTLAPDGDAPADLPAVAGAADASRPRESPVRERAS